MIENLKHIPEWAAWIIAFTVIMITTCVFIVVIMLAKSVTDSPSFPERCGPSGVRKVIQGDSNTDYSYVVVCQNGTSFRH